MTGAMRTESQWWCQECQHYCDGCTCRRYKHRGLKIPPRRELAAEVYTYLTGRARVRQTVTYGDVARHLGLDPQRHRQRVAAILGDVSHACVLLNRPMLSAVVVGQLTGVPGEGFFQLAKALDVVPVALRGSFRPDRAFWDAELERVFAHAWGRLP